MVYHDGLCVGREKHRLPRCRMHTDWLGDWSAKITGGSSMFGFDLCFSPAREMHRGGFLRSCFDSSHMCSLPNFLSWLMIWGHPYFRPRCKRVSFRSLQTALIVRNWWECVLPLDHRVSGLECFEVEGSSVFPICRGEKCTARGVGVWATRYFCNFRGEAHFEGLHIAPRWDESLKKKKSGNKASRL